MSSREDRLARAMEAALTRRNGVETLVKVQDGYAYVLVPGDGSVVRHAVPPEAYPNLALYEARGSDGFAPGLLG